GNYFLMGGSPVDNNAKLFRAGQMKVLKPYVDSGKIKVVGDQWVDGWLPENALKIMENALTANNNKIDAVVAVSYTHLRAHETLANIVCRL
ncbi:hypothetical protein DC362_22470, partial [Acinetobacter nosocomialis]